MYGKIVLILILIISVTLVEAQPSERRITREEYIEQFKEEAIKEMHASGVPASITLSQGMLESDYGNSPLARYAKNHFGIKCHNGWAGPTFYQDDDAKNECFRKYYSAYESYRDHSEFLMTRDRYASLFDLKVTDYKGWAKGLKKAGYATNPKYADLLIKIIEENKLYELDRMKKIPKKDEPRMIAHKPKPTELKEDRHSVKVHDNNIKYTIVAPGDTYFSLAEEFNMGLWQIYKYNDLNKEDPLKSGDVIYLQPKRRKAKKEYHEVKEGDTMRSISQQYGIKLKHLYSKNLMTPGTEPEVGDRLNLRKKKAAE